VSLDALLFAYQMLGLHDHGADRLQYWGSGRIRIARAGFFLAHGSGGLLSRHSDEGCCWNVCTVNID
jgi:hypothetical protein